ncbi:palmitoyltransferase ZDHHC3-like isoform X2 [Ptychodera flava]|uniref:palmitoyltransferase ZDHHC3-like isoform X2 n=1 Tax=Ptychodera flava TaxID=63121 RepID=UPI00396AA5D7
MVVFRTDPCGITCIIITYVAVFYADYVVIEWLIIPSLSNSLWGGFNAVLFNILIFFLLMSHARAVFSDPGIVPLPSTALDFSDVRAGQPPKTIFDKEGESWTVCQRCETYRPPRAHHCRICRRCIRKMDHHCPWINNCVGEFNQRYFIQFLFYVGVASIYSLILVLVSWLVECKECEVSPSNQSRKIAHTVILIVESILFGLFVTAILCDQLTAIFDDETGVEAVQKKSDELPRAKKPKMALLSEVFGRGPMILWLFPCQQLSSSSYSTTPHYDV